MLVAGEDNSRCGSIALAALDRLRSRHGVCCGGADRVRLIGVGEDVAADERCRRVGGTQEGLSMENSTDPRAEAKKRPCTGSALRDRCL